MENSDTLSEVALHDLSQVEFQQAEREARLVTLLASASNEQLIASLRVALGDSEKSDSPILNVAAVLRVGHELTKRGVAPVFRGIPYYCGLKGISPAWQGVDTDEAMLMLDAQWVAKRYPSHSPEWKRAEGIFDSRKFEGACSFLHWSGRRAPGQIVKAMSLSEGQQRELAFIHAQSEERYHQRMWRALPKAEVLITDAIRAKDRRPQLEQDLTIRLRVALWQAAVLGDWKPTRVASLLAMQINGYLLPRNRVGALLQKLPSLRECERS